MVLVLLVSPGVIAETNQSTSTTEAPSINFQEALDQAMAEARAGKTFVLADAFTTWCGPCKAFQRDLENNPAIREMLSEVVFLSIDMEDSTSAAFGEAHPVSSVPQFILMDADGVENGRIAGYKDAEDFQEKFKDLLAAAMPDEQRLASFTADASWEGQTALARHYAQRKEFEQAASHFANALERGAPGEQRLDLIWPLLVGLREGWSTVEQIKPVAEAAIAQPADVERYWYRLYTLMKQVAERAKDDSLRHPYLEKAFEEESASGNLAKNPWLRFDYAHYHLKDHLAAAQAKRDVLEIQDNVYSRNLYAWYCFEHRVQLVEAEEVAREGVAMDDNPAHVAMLMDTLAELVFLKGETNEALQLVERCMELDPENKYYRDQQVRFKSILDNP
ncbi:MAG: thioredoxin family protein [Candidatus Krumholzibacteriota bacterium]